MENGRKSRGLQICQTKQIKKIEGGFLVPSQNSNKNYFVSEQDYKCTCPDCQARRSQYCKHAYAVRYYLQIEKADGTTEKVRLTYGQAWHAYNRAQQVEVNEFDRLLSDLLESVEEPEYKFGRPTTPIREQLFCSVQKVYSQLSSRRAKSLFNNAQTKGFLKNSPHFNTTSKFLNRKEGTPILKGLIRLSALPLKEVESQFAVDSSGFRTTQFNEYCKEKHGTKKKHKWLKAHICTGVKTNVITGIEVTDENGSDSPQFAQLIQTTANNGFSLSEVSADKAYNSIANYNAVREVGGQAFIPFKSNTTATVGRSGNRGKFWRKMFHYFKLNQEEFAEHYHKRSNVETTFHMIKTKFGDKLKSKNRIAQENELLCKILAHNIVVLIHEMQELEVNFLFTNTLLRKK